MNDKLLWNPLEQAKIEKFSDNFEKYLVDESDEMVKTNPFRQLFLDIISLKEYKCKE